MLILSIAGTSDTIQAILEHVPNIRQLTAVTVRKQLLVTKPRESQALSVFMILNIGQHKGIQL